MKILYFPTHEALEYDDVRLFRGMGHTVFSLGRYSPAIEQKPEFRSKIIYDDEQTLELVRLFREEGCAARFLDVGNTKLTKKFVDEFDFVISIQDVGFLLHNWNLFERATPVWRTVGQAIDHFDAAAAPLRERGLKVVRWSSRERYAATYIGHDAIIRGYKYADEYHGWVGVESKAVTFSNGLMHRYPIEGAMMQRMLHDIPYEVGGSDNGDVANSIGLLEFTAMKEKLRTAGLYFYGHGCVIPYTLNYIEAWMTGIPLVAARKDVEIVNIDMKYNEINDFIVHGVNGMLYKSEVDANQYCKLLLNDKAFARGIGSEGRKMACRIFGADRASADWQSFFDACLHRKD